VAAREVFKKLLRNQEMCESTRSAGDVAIRRLISESGYWQQAETKGSNPFWYANEIKQLRCLLSERDTVGKHEGSSRPWFRG
jgi:hypothetical protein